MDYTTVIVLLAVPVIVSILCGLRLLRKALGRSEVLVEELGLAFAWVFLVGSLVWLGVFLWGGTLLGFSEPWTWITAAHFAFAGYGALTVTSLCCRVVSCKKSLRVLRFLLIVHPIAYFITAAGILGYPFCDEIAATSYAVLFVTQLIAVALGRPDRISNAPKFFVFVALIVPVFIMVPALAWAWGRPMFDMSGMVHYHGIVNALGHVGVGLFGFALGCPPSHSSPPSVSDISECHIS